jgi:perosamine synthetase
LSSTNRLAIEGGAPVRPEMLPYGRQWVDTDDVAAVVAVLQSDWLTTGPKVAEFEAAFAGQVDAAHAVAVSSGTAALHTAVAAAGIRPGDEVIVPPLTFAASANCVRYQGGTVVFVDVRRDTLTLDPALVERAVTPRTRAIVTVDYAGQPSDLDDLLAIAARHELLVIEDACHALGATYRTKAVGGLAHLTAFSLHPVKHITAGEGGVVATNDAALAHRMRVFRNHGITSDHRQREAVGSWAYEMEELGWNYRLTDFQCALALSQLRKLPGWIGRRREIAARYTAALATCLEVETPYVDGDKASAWHLYPLRVRPERLRVGRAEVFRALRAENIGVNVHYVPVPWHPYYRRLGYVRGQWPVAEEAYERLLSLPLFPAMRDADVEDVVEAVRRVVTAYRS